MTAPSDTDAEATGRARRRREVHDFIAVFVLSASAVLTAWCGFEASKWSGAMAIAFNQASAQRVLADDYDSQARDDRQLDVTLWGEWLSASTNDDADLADDLQNQFSPELASAFDEWMSSTDTQAASPFDLTSYVPTGAAESTAATRIAEQKYTAALVDNQRGDNYSVLTVVFSMALFFAGMAQRNIGVTSTRALLGLAVAALATATAIMFTYPVLL